MKTQLQHEDFEVLLDFENEGNTNEERVDTFLLTIKDYLFDYEKELEDKEDEQEKGKPEQPHRGAPA